MFDGRLRKLIDPPLDRVGGALARLGLNANAITVVGFLIGAGAWAALAFALYPLAMALVLLNRLADGLDGAVARRRGMTDLGGYLDIVLDFFFYAGVPFFFAVGRPEVALPAAFLVFSFVGTGSSFLAFAAVAAKRGLTTEARGSKSIYYLGGLTEGAETIALFVLICLLPEHFALLAWVFGGLCWLTTASRVAAAVGVLRDDAPSGVRGRGVSAAPPVRPAVNDGAIQKKPGEPGCPQALPRQRGAPAAQPGSPGSGLAPSFRAGRTGTGAIHP